MKTSRYLKRIDSKELDRERRSPVPSEILEASARAIDYPVGSVGPLVGGHPVGKAFCMPPGGQRPHPRHLDGEAMWKSTG